MNATISIEKKPRPLSFKTKVPTTLAEFQDWKAEDGYKYEWNNGILEKTPKMIIPETFYIVDNLFNEFDKLKPGLPQGGRMYTEPQANTSSTQVRVPDIAYYTMGQIREAAEGEMPVPGFAAEMISKNHLFVKVFNKVEEYFKAGVQVVWLINPFLKQVHVYHSPEDVAICRGKKISSADTVIPGFKLSVDELFLKN